MPASPTIDTIRAAIASAIKSALNSGSPLAVTTVHDYRRFWRDEEKFRALFKRTDSGPPNLLGKINGWMISRISTREVEVQEWFRFYQIHRFELYGYLGVQDAVDTEKVFQDQIESIRDNLRKNTAVFATTERINPVTQVESVQAITVGESTCWNAVLSLEVEAIENKFS